MGQPTTWQIVDMLLTAGIAFGAGGAWWRLKHLEKTVEKIVKRMESTI